MVHFVDVMCRFNKKMHLNHFKMDFGIGLGWPQKEDSLVAGDRDFYFDVV